MMNRVQLILKEAAHVRVMFVEKIKPAINKQLKHAELYLYSIFLNSLLFVFSPVTT